MNITNNFLIFTLAILLHISVFGINSLNLYDITWLLGRDDISANVIGNLYFSKQDWSFPYLLNKYYGFNGGTVLYFSGSPVLGLLLKFLNALGLIGIKQLVGLWLLVCSYLSFLFSFKILKLFDLKECNLIIGAFLLWTLPFLWDRSDKHIDLFGQWILVASIYFILNSDSFYKILLLSIFSLFVNPYFLPMIIFLNLLLRKFNKILIYDLSKILIMSIIILLVTGVSSAKRFADSGFGLFKSNVLTWFDSNGFSFIAPDIPNQVGENEGFGYIGAPFIFLLTVVIVNLIKNYSLVKFSEFLKEYYLNIMWMGVILFISISTTIGIGSLNIELFESNSIIFRTLSDRIFSIFRVTGRFIWLPSYLLAIFTFWYLNKINFKYFKISIFIAFFLSMDNFLIFNRISNYYKNSTYSERIFSDLMSLGKDKFLTVYVYPSRNGDVNWEYYSMLAFEINASTNSVLVARYDIEGYKRIDYGTYQNFLKCEFDDKTLYFVDSEIYKLLESKNCINENIQKK
jgi:hypothetical protein